LTTQLNRPKAIELLERGATDERASPETRAKAKLAADLLKASEARRGQTA
jgi:hypothetical protein